MRGCPGYEGMSGVCRGMRGCPGMKGCPGYGVFQITKVFIPG